MILRAVITGISHCVKSFRIPILWSVFSRIRLNMEYLSVFSPNKGKYGPDKLRILALFTQWVLK